MGIAVLRSTSKFLELPAEVAPVYPTPWPALIVTKSEIESEIGRLLDSDRRPNERRASEIVHPGSRDVGAAVTPGLSISINVVRPGEHIEFLRDNASRVEFCLQGGGIAAAEGRQLEMARWNVCAIPSMTRRTYTNGGVEPLVWLSYSNVPLLERMGVYYSDSLETERQPPLTERSEIEQLYTAKNAPDFPILSDGARLRGYEFVTDIEVVNNRPLVWPWSESTKYLCQHDGDGKRALLTCYNPATGRREGTSQSFFAALTRFPAGVGRPVPLRGHKHSSFACNYHFEGSGESIVDGQHYDWEAGDLMLSAPSWSEHAHGIKDTGASVLTVQDHPFQIAMESLIWQEKMDGPILTLGSEQGQTGYIGPRQAAS
jgi:gentisate 1,2-dioxygenase